MGKGQWVEGQTIAAMATGHGHCLAWRVVMIDMLME